MKSKEKIGLITYHSAYNFGSVLQAYATVKTIEMLGYSVETIDYQTKSQIDWYHTDFSLAKSLREKIDTFGFIFQRKFRERRAEKFEDFIYNFLNVSEEKYHNNEDFRKSPQYDILISGSDQIWNIGCGEFKNEKPEAILPYFLKFGNPHKKIAYASSFGSQNLRTIRKYSKHLLDYDFLSTREPIMRDYIKRSTGKEVKLVCDPTWLLNKDEWLSIPGIYNPNKEKPYILVYSLYWSFIGLNRWMPAIKELANRNGWDVILISPVNYYRDKEIKIIKDAGPLDFLSYLSEARMVITNTFHGTIFSMNFNIPFFSCLAQPSSRQGQMLALCHLEDRVVNSPSEISRAEDIEIDFSDCSAFIRKFRNESIDYLKNALK